MESSFEKLLVALTKANVLYITVGGVAVSLNGFLRLTEDVDIIIESSEENIQELLSVLCCVGEGYAKELSKSDFVKEEGAIRVIESSIGLQVDIFVQMKGCDYQAFDQKGYISFFQNSEGTKIPYLSREGLIFLKNDSQREKDQIDVSVLKKML